jgi:acetyltransferase (GNAT) family protein
VYTDGGANRPPAVLGPSWGRTTRGPGSTPVLACPQPARVRWSVALHGRRVSSKGIRWMGGDLAREAGCPRLQEGSGRSHPLMPSFDIRPMEYGDVHAAEVVWQEAFADMRARVHLPARPHDDQQAARTRRRLLYFLESDPGGSWVATCRGEVVGLAQAIRRGQLWILSLFGVAIGAQGRGVGRQLLDRVLGYGEQDDPGLILSSCDPRAMRRYVAAGFALHPVVAALGRVQHERLPVPDDLREGSAADIPLAEEVDKFVRGAGRERDIAHLLDDGARMLVVEGRGYAVVRGGQPLLLAAMDDAAARTLLLGTLSAAPADQQVEVGWLGGGQQWAIDIVVAAGLELRPSGAIMIRGLTAPPRPCIPNGSLG